MGDERISFLEREIQDLFVSVAGCHRPNLESSQSTRSPYVQKRQQKEKNRRSLEGILPPPAPLPLPHPETSFCHSNSGRRLQVIIRQGPGVVLSSAVHFEIGARERPISPPLKNATGTNSSSRILRIQSVSSLKSRGSNKQVDTVRSPISKFRPRQTSVSALFVQRIVRHFPAILQAIRCQSSRKRANLAILKGLLNSARTLVSTTPSLHTRPMNSCSNNSFFNKVHKEN
ncbi:hypothetical protein EAE99_006814 [Botrytis elliptica]|nr:hypothetical protein EAE99_006814 [Botrytis elliptica]